MNFAVFNFFEISLEIRLETVRCLRGSWSLVIQACHKLLDFRFSIFGQYELIAEGLDMLTICVSAAGSDLRRNSGNVHINGSRAPILIPSHAPVTADRYRRQVHLSWMGR